MSHQSHGLLLRYSIADATQLRGAPPSLSATARQGGYELEPLFTTRDNLATSDGRPGFASAGGRQWFAARRTAAAVTAANPWDEAHTLQRELSARVGMDGGTTPDLIEPDLEQQWPIELPPPQEGLGAARDSCDFEDQNPMLPRGPLELTWHLGNNFSQLRAARLEATASNVIIRIAHLDTGYDPEHATYPRDQIEARLQRNFFGSEPRKDARDPGDSGLLRNPGHGTATLAILAGGRIRFSGSGYTFDDFVGADPLARIVPVRVGNTVVQLTTSSVAQGISYVAELAADPTRRVDVISMSMGGVASAAWADAVNKAYEAGILFVAAAGNNISVLNGSVGFPTRQIVYPARFRRVIAACGVMADGRPYFALSRGTMQGNWGPAAAMETAMAAFTPNVAWALFGCGKIVSMNGQGTSAATPQIAAAAALYLRAHADALFDARRYPEPWMRVEAVREALFRSAKQTQDPDVAMKLGRGMLRAKVAVDTVPIPADRIRKTQNDRAGFPFLNVLSHLGLRQSTADAMLELEAAQLPQLWQRKDRANPFDAILDTIDHDRPDLTSRDITAYLELIGDHPLASKRLKERAQRVLESLPGTRRRSRARAAGSAQAPAQSIRLRDMSAPVVPPPPPHRLLRGYAFDPSLTSTLATVGISEVQFKVPWEKLARGPIGEYLEVIDIDPASQCFYEPIDLDDPILLAQQGVAPSEGMPQFHQQMVYAVASLTISHFERALGRKVLWRPGPPPSGRNRKDDSHYVQRLRIYPHALRDENAYYSPQKVALLFGYFEARGDDSGDHIPGGQVFTCLSHDIIAHETTHALLDGMHRKFILPSNPDVRAFHEAFADCVALFQHFTFPEIVAHQIATTRGDLSGQENLLGQLASQFGRATGRRSALRDAIGTVVDGEWKPHDPKPTEYERSVQPHDRGAVLVAAIFDAFLSIYRFRTSDLIRLVSEGTGILRPGAIPPDLTRRLANEAAKSAQHVLTMCIRALDYCPPTDITFGEYLRAIITADTDLVPDDDLNYRVAFTEAFRRRGIYPANVRTLSAASLPWRNADEERPGPSTFLADVLEPFRQAASSIGYVDTRQEIFEFQRKVRMQLHQRLQRHFKRRPEGLSDAAFLGLDPRLSFEVHSARFANRVGPHGELNPQLIIGLLQEVQIPADASDPDGPRMPFEGGCTIVAGLREKKIRYCIRKNLSSQARRARQQEFALRDLDGLRATYFGMDSLGIERPSSPMAAEPFAVMHRGL